MRAKLVSEQMKPNILKSKPNNDIINDLKKLSRKEKGEKLIFISYKGRVHLMDLLIKGESDVNYQNAYGNTALIMASKYGRRGMVKLLLNAGADQDIKNKEGNTALTWAKYYHHDDIIALLKNKHTK